MLADRTSLIELGLLPDAAGAWPLATWLDTTHTPLGHDALKQLIASPLADVENISARQVLLRKLESVTPLVPWADLKVLAVQVNAFLSSNYVIVPSGAVQRATFAMRFGDIVTDVARQLHAVDALMTVCDQVYSSIAALKGDVMFQLVLSAFEAAVRDPRRERLRAAVANGSRSSIAGLDGMVRDKYGKVSPAGDDTLYDGPWRGAIQSLVAAIWQLDAFCSLSTASAATGNVMPQVVTQGAAPLALTGVRHPLLRHGVENDISLGEAERVLFLTGPNMAGKSTLLRAMGIAVHCAHLGMAVAARAARVPLYDQLLVSITVRDNLQRGESLHLAEIRRVRTIVDAVNRGDAVLAIFDEVFRGTNIKDSSEATSLLINGLSRASHGTFVIASHLADVADSSADDTGMGCWCMDVDMKSDMPRFTYRVRRGVSDVHLGMMLLDAEGVGPMLRRMAARKTDGIAKTIVS